MSLLTLFDAVEVKADVMISDVDRLFCEQTEKQYKELVSQLTKYKTGLEHLHKTLPDLNPAELEKRGDRVWVSSNSGQGENWTCSIAFSPWYGIKYIIEALQEAKKEYVKQIISYFNRGYNLDFSIEHEEEIPENPDWNHYVERIVQHAGGSLADAGVRNLIDAFRHEFQGHREESKPVLKGNTITFPNKYLKASYCEYMDAGAKDVSALMRAIGYFENGSTSIPNYVQKSFPAWHNDKIDHTSFRDAHRFCEKFAGHRYYKNYRLDLKFKSDDLAREFFQIFLG